MGELQIITGCMYAGKTAELMRRIRREIIAGRHVQLFKPVIDQRYSITHVMSHDKASIEAVPVGSTQELIAFLKEPDVIGIDEIQFFDPAIIGFCLEQVKQGKTVICSALATDFRGEPFKFRNSSLHIGDLLPHASITSLRAICTYREENGKICGEEADMTQRLIDGKPAPRESPLILVGSVDAYEARCRKHHSCE
jgi:thymidine kinase